MADKEELDMKKNNLNKFFEREQTKEKVLTTQKKAPPPKENVNLEILSPPAATPSAGWPPFAVSLLLGRRYN